jgi:hypothetical protein
LEQAESAAAQGRGHIEFFECAMQFTLLFDDSIKAPKQLDFMRMIDDLVPKNAPLNRPRCGPCNPFDVSLSQHSITA